MNPPKLEKNYTVSLHPLIAEGDKEITMILPPRTMRVRGVDVSVFVTGGLDVMQIRGKDGSVVFQANLRDVRFCNSLPVKPRKNTPQVIRKIGE